MSIENFWMPQSLALRIPRRVRGLGRWMVAFFVYLTLISFATTLPVSADIVDAVLDASRKIEAGDVSGGLTLLNKAIASNALSPDQLARAYFVRGEIKRRARDTGEAIFDLNKSLEIQPTVKVHQSLALAHQYIGNYQLEINSLNYIIRNTNENKKEIYDRGFAYLNLKKYSEAFLDFTRVINATPGDPDAYVARATVAIRQKLFQSAWDDLDQAARIAPNDPDLFLQRGQLNEMQGNTNAALAAYDAGILIAPSHARLLFARLSLFKQTSQFEFGMRDCLALLQIQPDQTTPFIKRQAPTACGTLALEARRYSEANTYFSQAIAASSAVDESLYFVRGLARGWVGQPEGALADLDFAISRGYQSADARLVRAVIRLSLGRDRAAAQDLNTVISLDAGKARGTAVLLLAPIDLSKSGEFASRYLAEMSEDDRRIWPWPVVAFFYQRVSRTEFDAIIASHEPNERARQISCDIPYYSALFDRLRTAPGIFNRAAYRDTMHRTESNCPPGSLLALGARLEAARGP